MNALTSYATAFTAAIALGWLAWVPPAGAEEHAAEQATPATATWDQEQATAAAADLVEAVDGLRTALRNQPDPTLAPGAGSRPRFKLRDRLRLMESESRHLQRVLTEGQGRDETLSVFERIDEIRRDAVQQAQRMFLQKPVLDKIDAARGPLETLAGLYGVTMQRQLQTR